MNPLTIDHWPLWPLTLVTLTTLSMETLPELVVVMESGVGHLQCASVSEMECGLLYCTCFCTGICFDVTSLMNGMISYSGDESPDNRPVATMATYTCNPNYTLNGGSIRTCGSDGVWSGSPPMCLRK